MRRQATALCGLPRQLWLVYRVGILVVFGVTVLIADTLGEGIFVGLIAAGIWWLFGVEVRQAMEIETVHSAHTGRRIKGHIVFWLLYPCVYAVLTAADSIGFDIEVLVVVLLLPCSLGLMITVWAAGTKLAYLAGDAPGFRSSFLRSLQLFYAPLTYRYVRHHIRNGPPRSGRP